MHAAPRILDGHSHAFPDSLAPRAIAQLTAEAKSYPVRAFHAGTTAALLDSMDRARIARALLCSVATRPTQVRRITDWSAEIASERLIAFASIHPDYDEPEAEVERIASLGLRGIKFHPQYMNCAVDDPRTVRIARAAAAAGLAMVLHAGHDLAFDRTDIAAPARILKLHEAVPDLRLMACHLGGWEQWEETVQYLVGRPIWMETSFCFGQCPEELLQRIVRSHPPEYLVFGTDSPWADQAAELAAFAKLGLSPAAARQALWENGHRFAGIRP